MRPAIIVCAICRTGVSSATAKTAGVMMSLTRRSALCTLSPARSSSSVPARRLRARRPATSGDSSRMAPLSAMSVRDASPRNRPWASATGAPLIWFSDQESRQLVHRKVGRHREDVPAHDVPGDGGFISVPPGAGSTGSLAASYVCNACSSRDGGHMQARSA